MKNQGLDAWIVPSEDAHQSEYVPTCWRRREWLTGFTGSACTIEDRVRDLTEARYELGPAGEAVFAFSCGGFLNYMVRNLVGTLLRIGRGMMEPEQIDEILASGNRHLAGPTAPAHGLCLWRVFYNNEELPRTQTAVADA